MLYDMSVEKMAAGDGRTTAWVPSAALNSERTVKLSVAKNITGKVSGACRWFPACEARKRERRAEVAAGSVSLFTNTTL
jgi:hypothetical protein